MKRLLILVLEVFSVFYVFAQRPYIPTVVPGTKFSIEIGTGMGTSSFCNTEITCDTIVRNEKTYHKVVLHSCLLGDYREAFIWEDTLEQKVYFLDENNEDRVYLEYNLDIGDTVRFFNPPSYTIIVSSVKERFTYDRNRKVTFFKNEAGVDDLFLAYIEGMGSTFFGPMPPAASTNGRLPMLNSNDFEACTLSTAVFDYGKGSYSIYPNPANETLFIESNLNSKIDAVEILTIEGKVLIKEKTQNEVFQIDLASLPNGIFVVKIKSNNGIFTERVIKYR